MESIINRIIQLLRIKNPLAAKKLLNNLPYFDNRHNEFTQYYLGNYIRYLEHSGLTIDFGVNCYVKLLNDMIWQRAQFIETGRYCNDSFISVDRAVYDNKSVMEYHMHGLLLAQFLWPDQYQRFTFFYDHLRNYRPVKNYLEIGAGHGLYISAARELLADAEQFDLVDVSATSLNLSKALLENKSIFFHHRDIFDFAPNYQYDFITIGEVIEHLEEPMKMLNRIMALLKDDGTVYLTTPVNAPMIDHIYLFSTVDEIRTLIGKSGFVIKEESTAISENIDYTKALELKIPIMYAAFIKKAIKQT